MNHSPETETFVPSAQSPLGKTRRSAWIGLALGLMIVAYVGGRDLLWASLSIFAMVFGIVVWLTGRQLDATRGAVTVDADGLRCQALSGPYKQIGWGELQAVTVESAGGSALLKLRLRASERRPDRRNFWTGSNPAHPTLGLGPYAVADQERLIDAIHRWRAHVAGEPAMGETPVNELAAERKFQEGLSALAPRTWATWALIAINFAIWGLTLTQGAHLGGTPAGTLLQWGGNAASEVQKGEWWRMLTSTFMHSGALHVGMNMVGLFAAGTLVERIYGIRLYLIVYFGAGLLGSAFSLHFSAQHAVSVGASGAVFGVTGALLVAVLQHRDKVPKSFSKQMVSGVGFFVFYSLLQGLTQPGIDNAAHIGGLVGGALAAFILPERFDLDGFRKVRLRRAFVATTAMAAATFTIAAMAPPAPFDQAQAVESAFRVKRLFNDVEVAANELRKDEEAVKAGRLSEQAADQRTRTVHAPKMRRIRDALSESALRPGDPREPLLSDMQRLTLLVTEALEMDSVFNEVTKEFDPADPKRAAEIEAELATIGERMKALAEEAKATNRGR